MAGPFSSGMYEATRALAPALPHQKMTPEAAFRAGIRGLYPNIPEPPTRNPNAPRGLDEDGEEGDEKKDGKEKKKDGKEKTLGGSEEQVKKYGSEQSARRLEGMNQPVTEGHAEARAEAPAKGPLLGTETVENVKA